MPKPWEIYNVGDRLQNVKIASYGEQGDPVVISPEHIAIFILEAPESIQVGDEVDITITRMCKSYMLAVIEEGK